jgi:hypothetical protein
LEHQIWQFGCREARSESIKLTLLILTRSAKMFSHFLLFAVMLLVAKRLVEVVVLLLQRLGRQTSSGPETTAAASCLPETGEPNVAG